MESVYYKHSQNVPFASKLSVRQRNKMFELFMNVFTPAPTTKILDVGVTCDEQNAESNYFEQWYPYPQNILCVGTEDGSHLEKQYPGITFLKVISGKALPFKENEFDIVFSNAVVEHAGTYAKQRYFIDEVCRVAKNYFITTPNRWFPVEMHTGIPLLHCFPAAVFRKLLRGTKYDYWSYEEHLNLLTLKQYHSLFLNSVNVTIKRIRLSGFVSNLVAYGHK